MNSVKTEGGGFKKIVFENVTDTLAGGLMLDVVAADYPDGFVPEGTPVAKDPATGRGKVVTITPGADPEDETTFDYKPLGLTLRDTPVDDNPLAGVVISGVARIKALPENAQDNAEALAAALPRITMV